MSQQIYTTEQGDMLDAIAFNFYSDESMIIFILKSNPGLIDQPLELPYGIEIKLPDAPIKPVQNAMQDIWA